MHKMSKVTGNRLWVFWAITLLFPFLLLALVELSLIAAGYNADAQEAFVEYKGDPRYMVFNHEFVPRYFPSFVPNTEPTPFRKEKKQNTFRVFVFGGSSALGFPYNFYYSFSNQLEQKLLLNTNGLNVEVINLGMTAVNSYVIRDLSKRVIGYDPDAVIIYAGHNEFYGSFGAGTTQFSLLNSIYLKRVVLWLKNFRLYQFIEQSLSSPAPETQKRGTLMSKVIKDSQIERNDEVYKAGIDQFQKNISSTAGWFTDKNIPVYIGTLASNLKDQPPLGDNSGSIEMYSEAEELFAAGDTLNALKFYESAKEADGIRFRAPEEINDVIRQISAEEGVHLVNTRAMLRSASKSGIEDASLFIDHLHPNAAAHRLMADLFMEHMTKLDKVKKNVDRNLFDVPPNISQFESTYANTVISRLLAGYPFQKDLTPEQEMEIFNTTYQKYLSRSYTDSLAAYTAKNNRFVPEALTEVVNRSKGENDSVSVVSHYYELLKWQLNSVDLIEKGIEYTVSNRSLDVYLVNMMVQILNDGNYDPRYMDVLSSLYLLNDDLSKAGFWLKESEALDPDTPRMLYNYARYHILKGDTASAQKYYSRYLQGAKN